jgi:PAS domain S-box-containing protein
LSANGSGTLISVKPSFFRHPAVIAAGGALLAAMVLVNVAAFAFAAESPWILGAVILADFLVMGASLLGGLWAVAVWGGRSDLSDARLASIVESAMDGIITVDSAQRVLLFNRAAEQMFGMSSEDAIGGPLERFIPQRFRASHHAHVEQFGRTGVTNRRMGDAITLWALRADGSEFPIDASISQGGDPGRHFFTVILRDITRRKQYEDTLHQQQQELRELSARVQEAREEEKTRIARELHDELGQLLTALKMDLAWLRERLPAQWLVEDFGKHSGIRLELRAAQAETLEALSKGAATAVYRALQESLTNIARHSGAKNAWIVMAQENGSLFVEIEDDGRGIGAGDMDKARSLGLKGMRERVAYYGGSLEVGPAPRGGTRLRLRVPLQGAAAGGQGSL